MTAGRDLDRRMAGWFAEEAPDRAPDRLLEDALTVVGLTAQRPARGPRPFDGVARGWRALSRSRQALIAAAVLVALAALVTAGALLLREPTPPLPGLVLVRQVDPADPTRGVVVSLDSGTTTRELARFDAAALGGSWNGFSAAVGPTGLLALGISAVPDDSVTIVDLRATVDPWQAELPGYGTAWSPDGRLLAGQVLGKFLVLDSITGTYRQVPMPPDYAAVEGRIGPLWTRDGFVGTASGGGLGVVQLDGTFAVGATGSGDAGLGARRIDAAGRLLRCDPSHDGICDPGDRTIDTIPASNGDLYVHDDPTTEIADYAWARDGGLWLLTTTLADGPRTLGLVHIAPDGSATATPFHREVGRDDPDPNAYCAGGRFEAMAPDDSRFVIVTTAEACSEGPRFVVDPATGTGVAVDGQPAGWLEPDALERPRIDPEPASDVAEAIRGDWGRGFGGRDLLKGGPQRLHVGRSLVSILVAGTPVDLSATADGDDRLTMTLMGDALGCSSGTSSTYTWHASTDVLSLTTVDGSCELVDAVLEGTFERSLPLAGNFEPAADPARTYLWPEFGIRVTIPDGPPTSVWSRDGSSLQLAAADGHWVLEEGLAGPGASGVGGALTRMQPGLGFEDRTATTVAGYPAITGRIRVAEARLNSRTTSVWADWRGGFAIADGARLTIFEGPHGRIFSIVWSGAGDPAVGAWADALTASIDFTAD